MSLEEGSFVVVIGTNGSGKSTLLNAVAGTFLVDSGRVTLAGVDVTDWPEHRRAGLIGRVFQNPFSGTAPSLSIAENLALAARRGLPRGLGWALAKQVTSELSERVKTLEHGARGPAGQCHRKPVRRPKASFDAAHGHLAEAQTFAAG